MGRPSGGPLYAAWILTIIGAILAIVGGVIQLVPALLAVSLTGIATAIVVIVLGVVIIAIRMAEQLDEWPWIILALILGIIIMFFGGFLSVGGIGGLLVVIGAIIAIIAKAT